MPIYHRVKGRTDLDDVQDYLVHFCGVDGIWPYQRDGAGVWGQYLYRD